MPSVSESEAAERVASGVEHANPVDIPEFYAELYPGTPPDQAPTALELASLIRAGLEPEEIVALWNVVFPRDRNVWYDEEDRAIYYNEETEEYAE